MICCSTTSTSSDFKISFELSGGGLSFLSSRTSGGSYYAATALGGLRCTHFDPRRKGGYYSGSAAAILGYYYAAWLDYFGLFRWPRFGMSYDEASGIKKS